jgi:pimeloyl-ACP methyl ester carboxylesterase
VAAAGIDLFESGIKLPPRFEAYVRVIQGFSRRTLGNEPLLRDWLEVFEISPVYSSLSRSQLEADVTGNRLGHYQQVKAPCLVIGFEDDLIIPPYLCREVAANIPGCAYQEIEGCGHYGYLEEPARVNTAVIDFFRSIQ